MQTDPTQSALGLMRSAWAARRESFEAPSSRRRAILGDARVDLTTAADMLRDAGPPVTFAHALHLLANIELDLGHEERAQSLWEQAVGILRATDDALQLAHKVRHLGDVHRRCGGLREADACYSEALALYREHDGPGSLDFANAVSRMAGLRQEQGRVDEALTLWRETAELYEAVGLDQGVAEATRHIDELRSPP